jgi:hypothetical protein
MDRVTKALVARGVEEPVPSVAEGTSVVLNYPCCSELFNHRTRHGFSLGPGTCYPRRA